MQFTLTSNHYPNRVHSLHQNMWSKNFYENSSNLKFLASKWSLYQYNKLFQMWIIFYNVISFRTNWTTEHLSKRWEVTFIINFRCSTVVIAFVGLQQQKKTPSVYINRYTSLCLLLHFLYNFWEHWVYRVKKFLLRKINSSTKFWKRHGFKRIFFCWNAHLRSGSPLSWQKNYTLKCLF